MALTLKDNEFDVLIRNPNSPKTQQAVENLGDEDLNYLLNRVRATKPTSGAQSRLSQRRLLGIQKQQRAPRQGREGGGIMGDVMRDPSSYEVGSGVKKQRPPSLTYGEAAKDIQQRKEEQEVEGVLLPSFTREDVGALGVDPESMVGGATQAAMNVPTGVSNILLGAAQLTKQMGTSALGGFVDPDSNSPVDSAIRSGMESVLGTFTSPERAGEMLDTFSEMGDEDRVKLMSDLQGMAGMFYELPYEVGKYALESVSPAWGAYLQSKGVAPSQLGEFMRHDPVGTMLFMFPWLKAAKRRPSIQGVGLKGENVGGTIFREDMVPHFNEVAEFVGFSETGKPVKEATYKLRARINNATEGEIVTASALEEAGYRPPRMFDRRTSARTVESSREFWKEVTESLADELKDKDLSPEQMTERSNQLADAIRVRMREEGKLTPEQEAILKDELVRLEEASEGLHLEDSQVLDRANERYERLVRNRQEGQPVTPQEIARIIRAYPKNAHDAARHILESLEEMGDKRAFLEDILYDEAMLAKPEFRRADLEALAEEHGNILSEQDPMHPVPKLDYLIRLIARERAARGQVGEPLQTPAGMPDNTRVNNFIDIAARVGDFWQDETVAPTRLGIEYRGFQEGIGDTPGFDMWNIDADLPGHPKNSTVSNNTLTKFGYTLPDTAAQKGKRVTVDRPSAAIVEDVSNQVVRPTTFDVHTNVDNSLGAESAGNLRNMLADMFGNHPQSNFVADMSSKLGNLITNARDSHLTSPAFKNVLQHAHNFYARIEAHVTSSHVAMVAGRMFYDGLLKSLAGTEGFPLDSSIVKSRVHQFAKFLNSEKAKAIKLRNEAEISQYNELAAKQLDPTQRLTKEEKTFLKEFHYRRDRGEYRDLEIPELTMEQQQMFDSDPAMKAAADFWVDRFQPMVESFAEGAGIETSLTSPRGIYVATQWYRSPGEAPKGSKIHAFERAGELGEEGLGTESVMQGTGAGDILWKRTKTSARSARRAVGRRPGPEGVLSESLRHILHRTLEDRLSHYNRRQLMEALLDMDMSDMKGAQAGMKVKWGGKQHPLKRVSIDHPLGKSVKVKIQGDAVRAKGIGRVDVLVPEPIANAYMEAVGKVPHVLLDKIDSISRYITASALLIPAEATMHGLGVFHSMLMTRDIGANAAMRTLAKAGGMPGRLVAGLHEMWSLEGEAFRADTVTLSQGALRTTHLDSTIAVEPTSLIGKIGEKLPVVRQLKDYVFGMPTFEKAGGVVHPGAKGLKGAFPLETTVKNVIKGLDGFETRARVAMLRALRRADPTLSNSEYRHLINNQLGTYITKLEPKLVSAIKGVDPFARAGVALTKTGIKSLAGYDALGFSGEIAINTITTVLTTVMLIKWLDSMNPDGGKEGGRWPWEIAGLKAGDIPIWVGERRYDVPFRLIQNSLYRGFNVTGLRNLTDQYLKGERDMEQLVNAWANGLGNAMFGRVGPTGRVAFTLGTGSVPYQIAPGEFLQAAPPSTRHPAVMRFIAAFKAGAPWFAKPSEMGYFGGNQHVRAHPDNPIGNAMYFAAKALGAEPTIRPKGYELRAAGSITRMKRGRVMDVAKSIVYQAGNIDDPKKRTKFIRDAIAKNFKDSERAMGANLILQKLRGLPQRYTRDQAIAIFSDESGQDIYAIPR